ncbi:MAG: hypothetical protein CM1200mP39_30210 [Dehalococcoidia bacterium]|nr:MAG: hypothetical protein CM1200mP39_30210 [Dehalococcoidia bacterium]
MYIWSGVTDTNVEFVVNAINDAHGTELTEEFYTELGKETLALEYQFNRDAGFTDADDELPEFFYTEPWPQPERWHVSMHLRLIGHWVTSKERTGYKSGLLLNTHDGLYAGTIAESRKSKRCWIDERFSGGSDICS